MSLRSGTGQDDHRPGGWTTYRMDLTANQLVGLLGTHSCSAFTSPPTSWLDCYLHQNLERKTRELEASKIVLIKEPIAQGLISTNSDTTLESDRFG